MTQSLNTLNQIAKEIDKQKGHMFFVGGFVRDNLLNKPSKDIDVEIHGLSEDNLKNILQTFGHINTFGKSFGVLMIKGLDIDFTLPRNISGTDINPHIGIKNAMIRRDFTMNTLMQNVLTGEIIDIFNGQSDIKNKIIRHVNNDSFTQDPLRVFRMAQFASRFEFNVHSDTLALCKTINLTNLPRERILEEFKKGLLKSNYPSTFIQLLRDVGALKILFPEIHALSEAEFSNTRQMLDKAARLKHKTSNPFAFMLSALFHHLRPQNTKSLIRRTLSNERDLITHTLRLIRNLFITQTFDELTSDKTFRQLTLDMNGQILDLFLLIEAHSAPKDFAEFRPFFQLKIDTLHLDEPIIPVITGELLISRGLQPGKEFGQILNQAFDLQLEGMSQQDILKHLNI